MRRAAAGLLALLPLVLLPLPAQAADPVPLDVAAAQEALSSGARVYRAPDAIADYDPAVVLPLLGATTRVVLAPPQVMEDDEEHDRVYAPLGAFARARGLRVVLVTGLDVQVVDGGRISHTELAEARETLAYRDVTETLRFAARFIADPGYEDDVDPADLRAPAPAALVAQVVSGLRASPRWVAPGAAADLGDGSAWPTLTPTLGVRVAALPLLERGTPYLDLLTPLAAAFPNEVVIVVRGTWLEAVGPDQSRLDSARNYVIRVGNDLVYREPTPAGELVRVLLERFADLRTADPFGPDRQVQVQVQARAEREGRDLWLRVGLPAGLVLLGAVTVVVGAWRGPRHPPDPVVGLAFRTERARVYTTLAHVAEQVTRLRGTDPYVARAAERHDAAVAWLERADATYDPAALHAAGQAVQQADLELRRAGLS